MLKKDFCSIARQILKKPLVLIALIGVTSTLQAQTPLQSELPQEAFTIALDQPLPLNPKVSVGEFDNGIRYYIRENSEPENRAELRLVVDVGSVLEEEEQVGLAHFLEHMAFNGTENFEKQEIFEFMESLGMQLGPGINASTSFDETIYQLQVPLDEPVNLDTALQIMEDWATALTLDSEEIDLERGVVIEEWRLGQGAQSRIRDQQLPVILKDSQYALRLPIGTLENLQTFDPDTLRQFYEDWYRPELMSVIAVGDFDVADVEELIREHFESIPVSENPKERKRYDVPEHEETLFSIVTDPEVPLTQVTVYHKLDPDYNWTAGGFRQSIVEGLYNAMLNARFQEMTIQANPPFLGASSSKASLIRPLSVYVLAALVQETGVEAGLQALLVEAERVERFGFTRAELDRQKESWMRGREQQYKNRESRSSGSHAAEMIRSYLTGESIPGAEFELALYTRFLPGISLEEVNQVGQSWISDANRVVALTAPEKDGLVTPIASELSEIIAAVDDLEISAYEDTTNEEPLLAQTPQGSNVVETQTLDGGLTQWILGNGIRVILKPTDFREDEILFSAYRPGGTSLASDEDYVSADIAITAIAGGGLAQFNSTDLQKKLAGKIANVIPAIAEHEEGVRGNASPADLETLFQLIYLRMTAPRADTTFFEILNTQLRTILPNRTVNPATEFQDVWTQLLYQDHFRRQPPTVAILDDMNLEKSLTFYQDRFGDASDFTFVFVGNIDMDVMQPLVETYLGGLPTSGREESWNDLGIRSAKGVIEETLYRGLEPKSQTRIAFTGSFDVKDNFKRTVMVALTQLLQSRLSDVMREELGGTYGVQVSPQMNWIPVDSYNVFINFGSDPERVDELTKILFSEIAELKESGPTQDEINDIRETLNRGYESSLERNGFWLSQLIQALKMDADNLTAQLFSQPEAVSALSPESVKDAANEYLNTDNYIQLTLLPEE